MKPIKKHQADIFFFAIVFALHFFMVFGVIKQMRNPAFSRGLQQSAEVMTRNLR